MYHNRCTGVRTYIGGHTRILIQWVLTETPASLSILKNHLWAKWQNTEEKHTPEGQAVGMIRKICELCMDGFKV